MSKAVSSIIAGAAVWLFLSQPAGAQSSDDSSGATDGKDAKPAEAAPPPDPMSDIVEKLLTSEDDEADLRWLYSNADEYLPSELTGRPIRAPGLPQRGEGSPRVWDPRWRRFGPANYVLTGASFLAAAAASFIPATPDRWRKRNDFDEWGRRTFGVQPYEDALWARDLSDVLLSVNITFPLLVDSLIVTDWYRRSSDVAAQMALITAETIAVSAAIQTLVSGIVSRERPYVRDCGTSIDPRIDDCTSRDRYRSFFSGHTSNAFTAASVTCSHHMRHQVFGDPTADGLACGAAMVSATTVGMMRVVGGRHYLSDVMTGAAVGTLTGFGLPLLLHYGGSAEPTTSNTAVHVLPLPNGVALGGAF